MNRNQSVLLVTVLLFATIGIVIFSGENSPLASVTRITSGVAAPPPDQQPLPARPTTTTAQAQPPRPSGGGPDIVTNPTSTPPDISAAEVFVPGGGSSNPGGLEGWNPPALDVPLARHPNDHYWFIRPVGANYNNFALERYPYGSNGPADDLRVHHGIDLANNEGVEIYAAASGTVVNAGEGLTEADEPITSYGNVVAIRHDIGYEGLELFTLYAHMSVILTEVGERVEAGDVIGLVGSTGGSTGPHVHFEVRVGRNSYFAVRNPALWMAPYAGTGTVAGRLEGPDGSSAQDVNMWLEDASSGQILYRTSSYAGYGALPDDKWNENFVFADVRVGEYIVVADSGGTRWEGRVTVQEGLTNWVDLDIDEDFDPTPEPSATP